MNNVYLCARREKEKMDERFEFDDIFRQYYSQLFFFAMQYIGDENECDDIVSSAYEDAWRYFANIERKAAQSWLFVNVKRKCLDWLRRQEHHRAYAKLHLHIAQRTTDDTDPLETKERMDRVARLLEQLPDNTRDIFTRCYVDGKKYREVAEELSISTETVKKHVVRALKMLRQGREKS